MSHVPTSTSTTDAKTLLALRDVTRDRRHPPAKPARRNRLAPRR